MVVRISMNGTMKLVMVVLGFALVVGAVSAAGFDKFGYNNQARIFNGPADGVDRVLDGTVGGDTAYANDHLVMKWNSEWDRGKAEDWLNGPYAAWETNEWNGAVKGGSGEVWHYKIKWIGPCGAEGAQLSDGGYCIWGQFEVIMDQGTADGVHEFLAKANPNGFGLNK
jgi:hypothetical protein